jgi:hypothetical protein
MPYGAGATGFDECIRLVYELVADAQLVVLVGVGERELKPPAAWRGEFGDIAGVLGECPPIEAVITTPGADWVIFDTHHDSLVVAGVPPGLDQARRLDR